MRAGGTQAKWSSLCFGCAQPGTRGAALCNVSTVALVAHLHHPASPRTLCTHPDNFCSCRPITHSFAASLAVTPRPAAAGAAPPCILSPRPVCLGGGRTLARARPCTAGCRGAILSPPPFPCHPISTACRASPLLPSSAHALPLVLSCARNGCFPFTKHAMLLPLANHPEGHACCLLPHTCPQQSWHPRRHVHAAPHLPVAREPALPALQARNGTIS